MHQILRDIGKSFRRYGQNRLGAVALACFIVLGLLWGMVSPSLADPEIERGFEHSKPESFGFGGAETNRMSQPLQDVIKLKPLKSPKSLLGVPDTDREIEQVDIYGVVVSVKDVGAAPGLGLLHSIQPDQPEERLQKVTVRLASEGPGEGFKNRLVTIDNVLGGNPAYNIPLKPGARVLINMEKNPVTGKWAFYIANRDRTPALIILGTLFVLAALMIGGVEVSKHLLLVALMMTGCYKALFPAILDGTAGPDWILLMCFTFTILASFIYKVPGTRSFNREQSVVILGTMGGLTLLGIILWIMHDIAPLNGYSSEGLASLWYRSPHIDYLTLLMAGALLGFQGFLFYLCWSLAQGRKETTPLNFMQRFELVMLRGRRILGPLISSLGLLFLGLFLPILLQLQGTPTAQFINLESTVSVLALAFSGGLTIILTVPLTAFIAAWLLTPSPEAQEAERPVEKSVA